MLVKPEMLCEFRFLVHERGDLYLPKLNLESLICACLSSFMLYEQGKTSCSLNMTSVISVIINDFSMCFQLILTWRLITFWKNCFKFAIYRLIYAQYGCEGNNK